MKIQQHNGVVMVKPQYSSRASLSSYGGGEVLGRGGAAPWMLCAALPLPLYL